MSGWNSRCSSTRGVRLLTCLVSGLLASVVCGCARRDGSATSPSQQVLRLSQRNEPGTLDPARATLPDEFAILRALSEGLLVPGENGLPQPGVATHFETSPDGLTYTFHLRSNARWSDGEPVTAQDFVESYRRLLSPGTAATKANVFFPVKNARAFVGGELKDFGAVGIRAPENRTIVVTLERPSPRFPYYVVSGPWLPVPVRVIEKHGRDWTRPENYVGNGPFRLSEWRPDQRMVVKRNPHWHDAAGVRLDEIDFVRFDSGDSEDRAYRTGQIDVTMSVPFSKVEVYTRERPLELRREPMIETRYLSFNTRRRPLDDARVRRALSLALDRQKIVELVLKGGQSAAHRFAPPALRESGVSTDGFSPAEHRFDPVAARRLLADAGITAKDFPPLEVTAWSPSQIPVLETAQQMWQRELGVEVSIATRDARVHLSALTAGDYDIAFITAIPDVADAAQLLADFVSGSAENYPHWSDESFDRALSRATDTANPVQRAAALAEAERQLLESAAIAPVYFNTKIWLMSPRVRGWQEDGLWSRCYHTVFLDAK